MTCINNISEQFHIRASLLGPKDIAFSHQGVVAKISQEKLAESSTYFESLFSERWVKKTKWALDRPEDGLFSSSLFVDLLLAHIDPGHFAVQIDNLEDFLAAKSMIPFYGIHGRFLEEILHSITYDAFENFVDQYEEMAIIIDRDQLAVRCCQVIFDEPDFIDTCLLFPSHRRFLAEKTLKIFNFFDAIRKDVKELDVEIYCENKTYQQKLNEQQQRKLFRDDALILISNGDFDRLEKLLKLFPNLNCVAFDSKDNDLEASLDYFFDSKEYPCKIDEALFPLRNRLENIFLFSM